MPRPDGFSIADIDTAMLDDPKMRRLWKALGGDRGRMAEGVTAYLATMLASWRIGARIGADDATPAWGWMPEPDVLAALVAVGLLDEQDRIPSEAFRSWFGPAYERRAQRRRAGSAGGTRSWESRSGAYATEPRLVPYAPNPTDRPTNNQGLGAYAPERTLDPEATAQAVEENTAILEDPGATAAAKRAAARTLQRLGAAPEEVKETWRMTTVDTTTLAPPTPVPTEPTTPMKISEAMRLGALVTEQAYGYYYVDAAGMPQTWADLRPGEAYLSCAIGAAALAMGRDPDELWLDHTAQRLPCPAREAGGRSCEPADDALGGWVSSRGGDALGLAMHLNDVHRWTREAVADWLEQVGPVTAALGPDLAHYEVDGVGFDLRPGTSDWKAVQEVWLRHAYQRPRAGFPAPQEGELWLDLGANIGAFTVWAAHAGAQVLAYEPDPGSAAMARTNVAVNGSEHRAQVFEVAVVADDRHRAVLHTNTARGNVRRNSLERTWRGGGEVEVERLDVGVIWYPEACVKMNVEGTEMPILEAMAERPVRRLVFEWSFDVDPSIPRFLAVVERLRKVYPNVYYPAFRTDVEAWPPNWFPPARYVWCWS